MRVSQLQWWSVVLVLAVVALAGCGGGASGGGGTTVVGTDFKFDPANVTVKAGSPAQVVLQNKGTQVHDWTIDSLGGQKVQGVAQANQNTTISFTPSQAGTFQVYCSQPGHREAGMVGQLTVQ